MDEIPPALPSPVDGPELSQKYISNERDFGIYNASAVLNQFPDGETNNAIQYLEIPDSSPTGFKTSSDSNTQIEFLQYLGLKVEDSFDLKKPPVKKKEILKESCQEIVANRCSYSERIVKSKCTAGPSAISPSTSSEETANYSTSMSQTNSNYSNASIEIKASMCAASTQSILLKIDPQLKFQVKAGPPAVHPAIGTCINLEGKWTFSSPIPQTQFLVSTSNIGNESAITAFESDSVSAKLDP